MKYGDAKKRFRRRRPPPPAKPASPATSSPAPLVARGAKLTITGPDGPVEIDMEPLGELDLGEITRRIVAAGFEVAPVEGSSSLSVSAPMKWEIDDSSSPPGSEPYIGTGLPPILFHGRVATPEMVKLAHLTGTTTTTLTVEFLFVGPGFDHGASVPTGTPLQWHGAWWIVDATHSTFTDPATPKTTIEAKRSAELPWNAPLASLSSPERGVKLGKADFPTKILSAGDLDKFGHFRSSSRDLTRTDVEALLSERLRDVFERYCRRALTDDVRASLRSEIDNVFAEMIEAGELPVTITPPEVKIDGIDPDGTAHITFSWPDSTPDTEKLKALRVRFDDEPTLIHRGDLPPTAKIGDLWADSETGDVYRVARVHADGTHKLEVATYADRGYHHHATKREKHTACDHVGEVTWYTETPGSRSFYLKTYQPLSPRCTQLEPCPCNPIKNIPPPTSHPRATADFSEAHATIVGFLATDPHGRWTIREGRRATTCYHQAKLHWIATGGVDAVTLHLHLREPKEIKAPNGTPYLELDPCPACNQAALLPRGPHTLAAVVTVYKSTESPLVETTFGGELVFQDDSGYPVFRVTEPAIEH